MKPYRALVVFALVILSGCNQDDADRLARVGQKVAGRVDVITGGADGKINKGLKALRNDWEETTLDMRVKLRLGWDKELAECPIQIRSEGAVIELKGTVPTPILRQRALELAESTTGVESVRDLLEEANQEQQ